MPFVYFASYGRSDKTKFTKLASILEELRDAVRSRLGADPNASIGFVDSESILTGDYWQAVLAQEIHSALVLVCLMSPTYFNSEWCAREFAVFRKRVESLNPRPRAIIPVLWKQATIPTSVANYQFKDDRLPPEYVQHGLAALRNVKQTRGLSTETIRILADIIYDAALQGMQPLEPMLDFDRLSRSFDNPGPYDVALMALHPQRAQWSIGIPGATLALSVDKVVSSQKVPWHEVPYDMQLGNLVQTAARERCAAIIVTDEVSANTEPFATLLSELDRSDPAPLAVLVGTNAGVRDDAAARKLLPTLAAKEGHYLECFALGGTSDFETRLAKIVTKLRAALVASDPPAKVADAALTQAADTEGIPIATRPGLKSPGGNS